MPARPPLFLVLALAVVLPLLGAGPAAAVAGDVFPRGKRWCASTHPNHGTPQGFGPALDLGSPTDFKWPLLAPADGRVRVFSRVGEDGWGNSIMWISADGRERIHMAHLHTIEATGKVRAGQMIGRVGSTGQSTSPHLHSSRRMDGKCAPLILGGRRLKVGGCYVSRGVPRSERPDPPAKRRLVDSLGSFRLRERAAPPSPRDVRDPADERHRVSQTTPGLR